MDPNVSGERTRERERATARREGGGAQWRPAARSGGRWRGGPDRADGAAKEEREEE